MALNEIIGSFVFRNEGDGCLTSKFLCNYDDTSHPESCKRETDEVLNDPFEGTYRTTWVQPRTTGNAKLEIKRSGEFYTTYC